MNEIVLVGTPSRARESILDSSEGLSELESVTIIMLLGPVFEQRTFLETVITIRIINVRMFYSDLINLARVELVSISHITRATLATVEWREVVGLTSSSKPLDICCLTSLFLKNGVGDII